MQFSDNKTRDELFMTYVIRTNEEMEIREESNSNLVEFITKKGTKNLFKVPARDIKIGESVYDAKGNFKAYRVN